MADRRVGAGAGAARPVPLRPCRAAAGLAAMVQHHRQCRRADPGQFCPARDRPGLHQPLSDRGRDRGQRRARRQRRRFAARLAGGAHRPAAAPLHSRPRHRLVRDAAVPRRDRVGNPRRAEQRPLEPVVPRADRRRPVRPFIRYLYRDRRRLCDGVLQLSLRLRAGRQRARQYPGRSGRRLGDPWRHARRDIAPGHPADGHAGIAGRGTGRLRADADPVRRAGDPRIAGGLSRHHDQDLGAVPISARAAPRRRRGDAAAGADDAVIARPAAAARAARLYRARRQVRRAAPDRARRLELAGPCFCRAGPRASGAAALCRPDQDRAGAHPFRSAHLRHPHTAQPEFRLFRVLANPAGAVEHGSARLYRRDRRNVAGACRRLCHVAGGWSPAIAF